MLSACQKKISIHLCEDTLTSSVFDYLFLLPYELIWDILLKSAFSNTLPKYAGRILNIEFWPKWNARETNNENFVEPDVFVRFEFLDLIIEAKRKDYNLQYCNQWENETQAYFNEYAEEQKNVYLLAIGGISKEEEEVIKVEKYEVKIVKCRWINFLNYITFLQGHLESSSYISSNYSITAILHSIITYLELHGYIKMNWLTDMVSFNYVINYDETRQFLEGWKLNAK